jgi:site-specific recombinase XerD
MEKLDTIRLLKLSYYGYIVTAIYTQDKIIGKVPTPKVTWKILPAISKEQLGILLNYCHCKRDMALISFLWCSGTRLSEAANIKAQDFNWAKGTVMILGKGNKYRRALAGNGLLSRGSTIYFSVTRVTK